MSPWALASQTKFILRVRQVMIVVEAHLLIMVLIMATPTTSGVGGARPACRGVRNKAGAEEVREMYARAMREARVGAGAGDVAPTGAAPQAGPWRQASRTGTAAGRAVIVDAIAALGPSNRRMAASSGTREGAGDTIGSLARVAAKNPPPPCRYGFLRQGHP